jgi:hypothetical protein
MSKKETNWHNWKDILKLLYEDIKRTELILYRVEGSASVFKVDPSSSKKAEFLVWLNNQPLTAQEKPCIINFVTQRNICT